MKNLEEFNPQLVLNSIYNGIVVIDVKGTIIYFNKTAETTFDIPAHQAIRRYVLDVLPHTGGKLLESLSTGTPFYGEKLKGQTVTLISNISPIASNGEILGVVSVFQDISEIENISKELDLSKDMKKWLDTIIDSSYDGLFICDHEGKVIRINKASERMGGGKTEEVVGRSVRELVADGLFDKSVTLEVLKRKTAVTLIQQVREGKKFLVTGNPIFDEKGEIAFVVTNERDISELDRLRSQLQETQALAKEYISRLSEMEMKELDLSNIIFRSKAMQQVIEIAIRVSKVDATVLLLGESGVGKGMISKLIHKHSERNTGPFIRVDCTGIPDSLIESELFGYEKGAFTGARTEGKPGLFELANKGTLFLDEIGEIPLNTQSKLLRFLEDHEIIRVGGTEARKIDVRIIAATNKDIDEMVASQKFREDLYYRLNVVPIFIPPLRERSDDIVPLVFHFLERFNKAYHKKKTLSREAVEAVSKYDFPGNIRELVNLIERVVVATEEDIVELRDIPNVVIGGGASKTIPYSLSDKGIHLREALERYERAIINTALRKYNSQRQAARILGIDQATLCRKIRKFSLNNNDVIVHK